jgi:small subunit ribosomal protein S17
MNKALAMNEVAKTEDTKLRTVQGRVTSNKMDKTVTIIIERLVKHALYGKYIRRSTKLHAHDADNACKEGDIVRVAECRPLSKTKNWRVVEIVARAAE